MIKINKIIFILFFIAIFLSVTLDKVIAIVGNRPVLQSEIQRGIDFIEKSPFFPVEVKDSLKEQYLEKYIDEIILEKIAEKDSIQIDSILIMQDVDKKIDDMIKNAFGNEEAYKEFLKANDITNNDVKHFYYNQLKNSYLKQQIIYKKGININIQSDEIKKFYEENKDSFNVPLVADLYHIAFIIQPDSLSLLASMQKVDALVSALKSGKSFSDIAKEYSDDKKTAKNGGIVGYKKYTELPQEIATFLYSFQKADTMIYTQSRKGFHIIKIIDAKGDSINYKQILIAFTPTEEDSLRAYNQAKKVYSILKNNEISFEDAAKKYSNDIATGMNGGYIGKIPISSLQDNIRTKLEKLENNQISDIIKGDFGYELFLLKNKEGGYQSPYIEVAGMIKMILENRKMEEEINKIIEKEKKKIFIKYINE